MIATILPGSMCFHAVVYNQNKVAKGVASLLEVQNFGAVGLLQQATTDDYVRFLQEYSSQNSRIKKPQFHVAISCKGHEMTESELLDFTHQYLKEMGYADPGQPCLIYAHRDTENTHLHVVTSRVNPQGKKILHDQERVRSQEVIDRILKVNRQEKTLDDLETAKQYVFGSFAQFKALMSSLGYNVVQKEDRVYMFRGGKLQYQLPIAEMEQLYQKGGDKARNAQLRAFLNKYREVCSNKEELQKEMKKKFGVDLVFFGKKDKPYGYFLVDHRNKMVIHGARVMAVEDLLDFSTMEQRFDRLEAYIDQLLTLNPKTNSNDLFKKLNHASVKRGVLYYNRIERRLKPFLAETIDRNNRILFVEKFQPTTETERDLLCNFYNVNRPDLVDLSTERRPEYREEVDNLRDIFNDPRIHSVRAALFQRNYVVKCENGSFFAVNFHKKIIINLNEENLDWSRVIAPARNRKSVARVSRKVNVYAKLPVLAKLGALRYNSSPYLGAHYSNREWEVGKKKQYDYVDDERSLQR